MSCLARNGLKKKNDKRLTRPAGTRGQLDHQQMEGRLRNENKFKASLHIPTRVASVFFYSNPVERCRALAPYFSFSLVVVSSFAQRNDKHPTYRVTVSFYSFTLIHARAQSHAYGICLPSNHLSAIWFPSFV